MARLERRTAVTATIDRGLTMRVGPWWARPRGCSSVSTFGEGPSCSPTRVPPRRVDRLRAHVHTPAGVFRPGTYGDVTFLGTTTAGEGCQRFHDLALRRRRLAALRRSLATGCTASVSGTGSGSGLGRGHL